MILKKIIDYKKRELKTRKKNFPLHRFINKIKKSDRDFKRAITHKKINLIAEIKRASPSEGIIVKHFEPLKIARVYEKCRVAAISILTEKRFFKGNVEDIPRIRKIVSVPILRKDFIIDEYQIFESRFFGADAILLIARLLTRKKLERFINLARKFNMACLVEVHTKKELMKALKTSADIIGINNRDLDKLIVDKNTTIKLAGLIPKNKAIVSESGIDSKDDVKILSKKVHAVLIGTSLLKSKSISSKIKELGF